MPDLGGAGESFVCTRLLHRHDNPLCWNGYYLPARVGRVPLYKSAGSVVGSGWNLACYLRRWFLTPYMIMIGQLETDSLEEFTDPNVEASLVNT